MVGWLDKERLVDTCANCYFWNGEAEEKGEGERMLERCAGCRRVRYCGKVCLRFLFLNW